MDKWRRSLLIMWQEILIARLKAFIQVWGKKVWKQVEETQHISISCFSISCFSISCLVVTLSSQGKLIHKRWNTFGNQYSNNIWFILTFTWTGVCVCVRARYQRLMWLISLSGFNDFLIKVWPHDVHLWTLLWITIDHLLIILNTLMISPSCAVSHGSSVCPERRASDQTLNGSNVPLCYSAMLGWRVSIELTAS